MTRAGSYLAVQHTRARGSSRLFRRSWHPDGDPQAVILLVHGLGEHSGRYEHVARFCTARGFAVHAIDHYGHGKSDGQRGYVERFSVYLDGVAALLHEVQAEHPRRPLFLLGHSMGGLIGAASLFEHQAAFRGCVLSGPAFKSDQAPPALVMAFVRFLSVLAPTAPLIQLDATGISRDPRMVEAYVADPLVHHGKLSARLITELSKAMAATLGRAADIQLPIFLMHGEKDVLASPAGSIEMHEHVSSADKAIKIYPGLYHEIFNEPEQHQVLADMSGWLEARI